MKITRRPVDPRQAAYEAVIADAMRRPFGWGEHDCVTFAGEGVYARTEVDHLEGIVTWTNAREAAVALRAAGGLRAAVTSRLGAPVLPGLACAGDVVLARDPHSDDGRELLALCHGPHLLAPGERGLAILPLTAALCAWKVGDA